MAEMGFESSMPGYKFYIMIVIFHDFLRENLGKL